MELPAQLVITSPLECFQSKKYAISSMNVIKNEIPVIVQGSAMINTYRCQGLIKVT